MSIRNDRVKGIREAKGFSRAQLSRISGISYSLIVRYETKSTPRKLDNLVKLSDSLEVSCDYLLGLPGGGPKQEPFRVAASRLSLEMLSWKEPGVHVPESFREFVSHPNAPVTIRGWRTLVDLVREILFKEKVRVFSRPKRDKT
ncbi:MAG: hypothetical protein A3C88_01435 [Candidatus Yanofskybacteria bacterium RIFCSPHIGHO2_02_FULL_50_12]|uniref:HTH cro/C1-type domain-containing protein n=1 Tax=Candidatus Yanofskybacteria bacterium RIFCSPHIGHO2_02_FULL_50_12 TaxID=1802685 RepID=A0A1F8FXI8_9BACT|nr:MAG: hypothetical protein A3C88_01435 [Candidatus Yanofskybacteria bacterium RIFCSPHIGHO2_02_FULL_50_12]